MKQEKRLENIKFKYSDNVIPSATKEAAIIMNLNMWFAPLIDDFNREKAFIVVLFKEEYANGISFENISDDLDKRAIQEYNKYLPQWFGKYY